MKTIEKFYRKIAEYLAKRVKPQTIQITISVSFTIISVCSMGILGVTLYNRFVNGGHDNRKLGAAFESDCHQSGNVS